MTSIIEDISYCLFFIKRLFQCRKQIYYCNCSDVPISQEYYIPSKKCKLGVWNRLTTGLYSYMFCCMDLSILKLIKDENIFIGITENVSFQFESVIGYIEMEIFNKDAMDVKISKQIRCVYRLVDKYNLYDCVALRSLLNVFFQSKIKHGEDIRKYHRDFLSKSKGKVLDKIMSNEFTSFLFFKLFPILQDENMYILLKRTNKCIRTKSLDNDLLNCFKNEIEFMNLMEISHYNIYTKLLLSETVNKEIIKQLIEN